MSVYPKFTVYVRRASAFNAKYSFLRYLCNNSNSKTYLFLGLIMVTVLIDVAGS